MTTIFQKPLRVTAHVVVATACIMFACASDAAPPPAHSLLKSPANPGGIVDGVAQRRSQLCWAASAEMVINLIANPTPQMTQDLQVAYLAQGFDDTAAPLMDPQDPRLTSAAGIMATQTMLTHCMMVPDDCDRTGNPILVGLTYVQQAAHLSKEKIMEEIGTQQRPFIFSWEYPDGDASTPDGQHFMVAVGYDSTSSDGFLVEVWDPWPVADPVHSKPGGKSRTITWDVYRNPELDLGLGAAYDSTHWQLNRFETAQPVPHRVVPNPPSTPIVDGGRSVGGGTPPPAGSSAAPFREVSFATAIRQSLTAEQRARVLRKRRPDVNGPRLTIGVPFPIVALRVDQIVAAEANPGSLLTEKTSVVLYPVMSGREVVDSFLMANRGGQWVETGYANTAVTSALVQVRQLNARSNRMKLEEFFLISVPQYTGFYAAFRKNGRTFAAATSDNPTLGQSWGRAQAAEDVLRAIARAAKTPRGTPN